MGEGQGDAEQIAGQIGGIPVITTATDVNHTFSVDLFAKKCGLDRKSTRLNSSHITRSRMPSSA